MTSRETRFDRASELIDAVGVQVHTLDRDRHSLTDRISLGMGRPVRISDAATTAAVDDTGRPLHSDPTGNAATSGMPDPKRDLREWDSLVEELWSVARRLDAMASRFCARPPTVKESREAELDNCADPHCTSCVRIDGYIDKDATLKRGTLCSWCYDHSTVIGGIRHFPPIEETRRAVERKRQGLRPRERVAG